MNMEFFVVMQAVLAEWAGAVLLVSQRPKSSGMEQFVLPIFAFLPVVAEFWVIW